MLHITGYRLTRPNGERSGFDPQGAPPTLPSFILAEGGAPLNVARTR